MVDSSTGSVSIWEREVSFQIQPQSRKLEDCRVRCANRTGWSAQRTLRKYMDESFFEVALTDRAGGYTDFDKRPGRGRPGSRFLTGRSGPSRLPRSLPHRNRPMHLPSSLRSFSPQRLFGLACVFSWSRRSKASRSVSPYARRCPCRPACLVPDQGQLLAGHRDVIRLPLARGFGIIFRGELLVLKRSAIVKRELGNTVAIEDLDLEQALVLTRPSCCPWAR